MNLNGRTVFVCRDPIMGPMFDQIALALEDKGIEVIRGPVPTAGTRLIYPKESHEALFSRAEVMMFSGTSLGSREVMLAAPRLRGIVNPAIGLETVDLDAARDLGIIVGYGATRENFTGMAEATVMLMLVLSFQLHRSERTLRENQPRPAMQDGWARSLHGRTIGLVGFGRIAQAVAERLRPFGVQLLVFHPRRAQAEMPEGITLVDLDELLKRSDFVSLHVTASASTRGMIGERELALMKPSAYLVNTARGEVIDEDALYRALRDRRIAGAGLDTYRVEPLPKDSPLRTLNNVVLTPHLVGQTRDSFDVIVPSAVENITRILAGEPPLYCKNPEELPAWRERLARLGDRL
ncbi:MAG: dehydrogenase [Betaproteobacteria bacterium]|nr:dehydrogenase [Betaproteobacteria bacterium]